MKEKAAASQKVTLTLEGKTKTFFEDLVGLGLIKMEIDQTIPKGEIQATVKEENGKSQLVVVAQAFEFVAKV